MQWHAPNTAAAAGPGLKWGASGMCQLMLQRMPETHMSAIVRMAGKPYSRCMTCTCSEQTYGRKRAALSDA